MAVDPPTGHVPMNTRYTLHHGDCRVVLGTLSDSSVDSIVTDPPYEREGIAWDGSGVAFDAIVWAECLRVLKPGGHLLAFAHPRNYHRLVCAVEDAGFEIRDMLAWIRQGSFPVSTHVSKKFDGVLGNQTKSLPIHKGEHRAAAFKHTPVSMEAKQWDGWGTALRNCIEPILLARKPLEKPKRLKVPTRPGQTGGRKGETLTANLRKYQTGALNLKACEVEGRWPTNVIVDDPTAEWSRYFFASKAGKGDRGVGNDHPTVKPTDLMQYLCVLVTPPDGLVLDPFMGSGSTGKACKREGFRFVGIDAEPRYVEIARSRIA